MKLTSHIIRPRRALLRKSGGEYLNTFRKMCAPTASESPRNNTRFPPVEVKGVGGIADGSGSRGCSAFRNFANLGASSFGITLRSGASFAGNFGTLTGFGAISGAGLISPDDTELPFGLGISAGSGRVAQDDMSRQMAKAPVRLCTNTGHEKFFVTNT